MEKLDMSDINFDVLGDIDDEIDCAILNDEQFKKTLVDVESEEPTVVEELVDGEDDIIDVNIDYSEDLPAADFVDMDADNIIAAERDIAFDPFEDDELIDIAINGDNDIEYCDEE